MGCSEYAGCVKEIQKTIDIPSVYLDLELPSDLNKLQDPELHLGQYKELWNASQISKSLGVSAPTVKHYLSVLEDTFIVRCLNPFFSNIKKRLVKSPKVYIRDSGLLHALLMTKSLDELQGHPQVGNSWEGFVIEQVLSRLPIESKGYFYRTGAGAEIYLVILNAGGPPVAVEIKYSSSPKVSKGFWNAFEDLKCQKGFVVYPGDESYPIGKNVFTLPIAELDRIFC